MIPARIENHTHPRRDVVPRARPVRAGVVLLCATALAALCACAPRTLSTEPAASGVSGSILDIHDPSSLAKSNGTYYLFSTGDNILIHCSSDMVRWRDCGTVFTVLPAWGVQDIPEVGPVWAPDISRYDGKFHLYYALSSFGSIHSDIGLATNATLDQSSPDYNWIDQGKVIGSDQSDDWNAIDPNLVLDAQGKPWLAFGSYWSGLKITPLDPATGKPPLGAPPKIFSIAQRNEPPDAIEASFIVYRESYYYLFASFDSCCRGVDSTYNVRVGRSQTITGPYTDADGKPMMSGGGTTILTGSERWKGPGGQSIYHPGGDAWYILFHSYDAQLAGTPTLRINRLVWSRRGWPYVAAFPK